jgi:hypothetical protein
MNFFKILLMINLILFLKLSLNKNTICTQTTKSQKALKYKKYRINYRLLRDTSIIISKDEQINPIVYSFLSRFGKKR